MSHPLAEATTHFAANLIAWQKQYGRHDLPWQQSRDPYAIWISEIMLQQTQVEAVKPYFTRWMERFPTARDLALASLDEVLAHWSGLGYYSRARNLHAAALIIQQDYAGSLPADMEKLLALPGIGRSTAAAIDVFAFDLPYPILDGNVKRVLTRFFGITEPLGTKHAEQELWRLAEELLPEHDLPAYIQGQMDLGATLCKRTHPRCEACPLRAECYALLNKKTQELPLRTKPKAKPERSTHWLLITQGGKLLLQKRPTKGIWGGLWSLPEQAKIDDMRTESLRTLLDLPMQSSQILPAIAHSFTHFRLHITPIHIILNPEGDPTQLEQQINPNDRDQHFMLPREALALGIPSPLRQFLISTFEIAS